MDFEEVDVDDPMAQDSDNDADIIEGALLAILDDEDSEDDEGNQQMQRPFVDIEGWRIMYGVSFRMHFKMQRTTFQLLLVEIGRHLRALDKLKRLRTPLDESLMFTVWVLVNPDTFRSMGTTFGKASSSIFHHYSYMIEALRELASRYIKWPSAAERNHIRTQFELMYGYPGVVGTIDGTFMEITAPLRQKQAYITRHHTYAITAQAVCDHNLLYRDVYVGEPGSVGDYRTFFRSPLKEILLRCPDAIAEDEHLLGDGAYPITKHILKPYADNGHLTPLQRRHNYELSRVRASIERSFGNLFGKCQRIKHFHTYNMAITHDHIWASFVLHNFRILHEVADVHIFEDAAPLVAYVDGLEEDLLAESQLIGVLKREYIARLFH